jgi:hypothetical protein
MLSDTKWLMPKTQERRPVGDQQIVTRVPQDIYDRLNELSAMRDRSMSSIMRIALREYLERTAQGRA